jgi:hypothetical protein
MMTSLILSFNAVSNLYVNLNINNQVHDDLYDPWLQRRLQPFSEKNLKQTIL